MPLIERLVSYAASAFGVSTPAGEPVEVDETLAAVALLVHVARADGVLAPAESERLARLVRARYAATDAEAHDLIARAAAFDSETRDMASLVERVGREGNPEERIRLLGMAWAIAGADGEVHEFEEVLVWRLGKLLGLDEAAITGARGALRDGVGPERPAP